MEGQEEKDYYILYSQTYDLHRLKGSIKSKLSGTDSEVFIPCMEFYKRGDKAVKTRPIFPNYIFVYTGIEAMELHKKIRDVVYELQTGIRELGFKEQYFGGFKTSDEESEVEFMFYTNISEKEAEYLGLLRGGATGFSLCQRDMRRAKRNSL